MTASCIDKCQQRIGVGQSRADAEMILEYQRRFLKTQGLNYCCSPTKHGIQWLLVYAKQLLSDLTEAEILDKSEVSTLVKIVTCLQAFWFPLRSIVRLAAEN